MILTQGTSDGRNVGVKIGLVVIGGEICTTLSHWMHCFQPKGYFFLKRQEVQIILEDDNSIFKKSYKFIEVGRGLI
jgi:hypothetical protein